MVRAWSRSSFTADVWMPNHYMAALTLVGKELKSVIVLVQTSETSRGFRGLGISVLWHEGRTLHSLLDLLSGDLDEYGPYFHTDIRRLLKKSPQH